MEDSNTYRWLAIWADLDGWLRETPFATRADAEAFLKGKNKPIGTRRLW